MLENLKLFAYTPSPYDDIIYSNHNIAFLIKEKTNAF